MLWAQSEHTQSILRAHSLHTQGSLRQHEENTHSRSGHTLGMLEIFHINTILLIIWAKNISFTSGISILENVHKNIYVNAKTHLLLNQSLNINQQRRNTLFPETHISKNGCFVLSCVTWNDCFFFSIRNGAGLEDFGADLWNMKRLLTHRIFLRLLIIFEWNQTM